METLYFNVAVGSFILAVCFLLAAVVVFFKMKVLDAIRYSRNKLSNSSSQARPAIAVEHKRVSLGALARHANTSTTDQRGNKAAKNKKVFDGTVGNFYNTSRGSEDSTEILNTNEASEQETKSLTLSGSENPTDFLEQWCDSERSTDVLKVKKQSKCFAFEYETSEQPTQTLANFKKPDEEYEASEQPTIRLEEHEASEQPTVQLSSEKTSEQAGGFMFVIRQQQVVTHTTEAI